MAITRVAGHLRRVEGHSWPVEALPARVAERTMTSDRFLEVTPKERSVLDALLAGARSPGELVCDPFLGSGTTAVAALRTGRRFVGGDIDAGAVAATVERLQTVEFDGCALPDESAS